MLAECNVGEYLRVVKMAVGAKLRWYLQGGTERNHEKSKLVESVLTPIVAPGASRTVSWTYYHLVQISQE